MTISGMPNIQMALYARNADALIIVKSEDITLLSVLNAVIRTTCLQEQSFRITSCLSINCCLAYSSSL